MTTGESFQHIEWRKSSFSGAGGSGSGNCVEAAAFPDGRVAIRNSNAPEAGALLLTRAEMAAWIDGIKAGEFDDLS